VERKKKKKKKRKKIKLGKCPQIKGFFKILEMGLFFSKKIPRSSIFFFSSYKLTGGGGFFFFFFGKICPKKGFFWEKIN